MQRMFDAGSPWKTDWLRKALPQVVRLCEARPERTIFSKFMPAVESTTARGACQRYYQRWDHMTLTKVDRSLLELALELQIFVPPATTVEKNVYSPWAGTDLLSTLGFETSLPPMRCAVRSTTRTMPSSISSMSVSRNKLRQRRSLRLSRAGPQSEPPRRRVGANTDLGSHTGGATNPEPTNQGGALVSCKIESRQSIAPSALARLLIKLRSDLEHFLRCVIWRESRWRTS